MGAHVKLGAQGAVVVRAPLAGRAQLVDLGRQVALVVRQHLHLAPQRLRPQSHSCTHAPAQHCCCVRTNHQRTQMH